jgi:SOS-response transcriptional repressor LexA
VRVGEDDVTLKYLDRVSEASFELRPHNPDYPTVEASAEDVHVEGVYQGLLRGALLDILTDADN